MKVCVTGNAPEYGLFYWLLKAEADPEFELQLLVTVCTCRQNLAKPTVKSNVTVCDKR